MYHVYRQSVHQTKIANRLNRKFLHQNHELPKKSHNIVLNQSTRQKRSIMDQRKMFLNINQSSIPSQSLILEAKLGLSVLSPNDFCKISIMQVVGNNDQGIALDSVSLEGEAKEMNLLLDISHAVQAWSLRPRLNLGLTLDLKGCTNVRILREDLDIIFTEAHVRHKRSPKRHRLRGNKRLRKRRGLCRRKTMRVDLTKLRGFDFIFMPKHFNAAMCSGKCPPRFVKYCKAQNVSY